MAVLRLICLDGDSLMVTVHGCSLNDFTLISLGVHWILTLFCYVFDVIGASTVYGMFLVLAGIRSFWHNCILVLVSSGLG